MPKKKSFVLYNDYSEHIKILSDEEAGKLIKAVFIYAETGEAPELQGMTKMAFSFINLQLDRDREKYEERCQKNREIALEREQKKRESKKARTYTKCTDTDNEKENDDDNVSEDESEIDKAVREFKSAFSYMFNQQ